MITAALIMLAFAHFIGDFILQSDWMAKNKSKNWLALSSHVLIYSTVLGLVMSVFFPGHVLAAFILINAAAHFITDAITSRITAYYWAKQKTHMFFVVIGFDQFIHQITLILTLFYCYGTII